MKKSERDKLWSKADKLVISRFRRGQWRESGGGKEAGCCGLEPLTVALKINQLYSNRNDVGVRLLRSSPVLGFRT